MTTKKTIATYVGAAQIVFSDADQLQVLDSWDAAEDSDAEREKQKKAAEAKVKAEAEARASKKSKTQRIEEHKEINRRRREEEEEESSDESEDENTKAERLKRMEKEADLKNAEDLFGGIGISSNRSAPKPATLTDPKNPSQTIDLSSLKLFDPQTRDQFNQLRDTLAPLLTANAKKAHYSTFMQEFTKHIVKDLPSEQIKKISSGLTTLSNEKMKEEKAAEKGGKKSKAAKTKTTLNAARETTLKADTNTYDDGLDELVLSPKALDHQC